MATEIEASDGGILMLDLSSGTVGEAFCSAPIVGQSADVEGDRIGDSVAFDRLTMEEL